MADGACECGAVRYRIAPESPLHVYTCHCLNCQTRSGSAFAEHALLNGSDFQVDGETVAFARESDGLSFEEVFCARCYTRLYNRNSALPQSIFLRAGTLSDSQPLRPIAHIWTEQKQPWVVLPTDVPAFPRSPTPEQFGDAIQAAEHRSSEP